MKYLMSVSGILLVIVIALLWFAHDGSRQQAQVQWTFDYVTGTGDEMKPVSDKQRPSDWFYIQRAYPYMTIPPEKPRLAFEAAREMRDSQSRDRHMLYDWDLIGPANIPGRITDLAIHDLDTNTIYAASASGGVFKSTNHGQIWSSIFDDVGVQSVGAIAIDPVDPSVLYVGTGEANAASSCYEGTGIYKSTDAGNSWAFSGLPNSYHIGRIVIDPMMGCIFVAVAGKHFGGTNPERGLYRSTDNGNTWEKKLYLTDSTSCIDVAIEPGTGLVLAAMWEKTRYIDKTRKFGGMTSGIWRSFDCGQTWENLMGVNGLPAPAENIGRIGVTIDPQSGTAYASIIDDDTDELYGVYKSEGMGESWTQLDDTELSEMFGGFGWYFGQIRVAPGQPWQVYILGVDLYASSDYGETWYEDDDGIHVDHHAMTLILRPPSYTYCQVYDGCDGGVNYKWNHEWLDWEVRTNMPNTQFYAITMDPSNPDIVFGGTQDNGTLRHLGGSSDSWEKVNVADGFYCVVDYADPNIVYSEWQYGVLFRSTDGGDTFYDALGDMDYYSDRHNWCTPFAMDPFDHNTLYYGSNRLWKTTNGGVNWVPISDDLTNGPHPNHSNYGTITTIAIASSVADVLYVGTDDGNVQVSTDGGGSWFLRNTGLPDRYVTRVAVDPNDETRAFVTISGYDWSEPMPHIFESTNSGVDWTAIHGNLPDAPINDVIPNPNNPDTIWIATDYGVYITGDHGVNWEPLGEGMPIVPVHDIVYSDDEQSMVAGTHGRSMYRISLLPYLCGDLNGDMNVELVDLLTLMSYVLGAGGEVAWPDAGDVDDCGSVNWSDVVYFYDYMSFSGPEPCEGSVICDLPTGGNSIELGCPIDVPVLDVDSIGVPIYISNDVSVAGFTLAFHYNSDDIEATSVDTTGTVYTGGGKKIFYDFRPNQNLVKLMCELPAGDPLDPQSGGLLATVFVQLPPGTPDQIINFDSIFVEPAFEFILSADGGGTIRPAFVDCGAAEIRIGSCVDGTGENCVYETATPEGTDIYVDLNDADVEFADVIGAGSTEMTITTTGPAGNSTFEIIPISEPLYYNITTTATYSGNVIVCIEYDDTGMSLGEEQSLTMQHWDGVSWTDITISVDTDNNIVCGETSELSPFVLALPSGYTCGDADASGGVDIDDVVYIVNYIFAGGPEPVPYASGDANCSTGVDIDDVVYLINYIFSGGSAPCDTSGDGLPDC